MPPVNNPENGDWNLLRMAKDTESAREIHEICPHHSGAMAAAVPGILNPSLRSPTALVHPCMAEYCRDFLTHLQHLSPSRYGSIAVFRITLNINMLFAFWWRQ